MNIKYIKLKNYKSFPDSETEIDLNFLGSKIITGHNGSGKTTIFDAIIWCIYGKSSVNVDDVINRKTKKNCKVEVGFSIGSINYSIIRYRNHETQGNNILFFKGKKNIAMRTKGDTQSLIEETIQMSYNAMVSSVIFSSELYSSFLRSKPSERLKQLESILSLNVINDLSKKLKKKKEPLVEAIDKQKTDRIKTISSRETLEENLESYTSEIKAKLLQLKENKKNLQEEKEIIQEKISSYEDIDIEKELEIVEIVEKNNEIQRKRLEEKKRLKDVDLLSSKYQKIKDKLLSYQDIDINKELNLNKIAREIEEENNKTIIIITGLRSKLKNEETIKKEIEKSLEELKELEKEKTHLLEHAENCPVCGQTIDKDLNNKLVKEINDKIEAKEIFLNEKKEEQKKIISYNAEIYEQLKEAEKNKIIEQPKKSDYKDEFLYSLREEISNLKNALKSLENEIENAEQYNKEIKERISYLLKEFNTDVENKYEKDFLENLRDKINNLKKEIKKKEEEIISIDTTAKSLYDKSYVEKTKEAISKKIKEEEKISKKLDKLQEEMKYYDVMNELFSNKDTGFKKFFIDKMIKVFNEKINFYLPFFFDDDVVIKFDKDLNEVILLEKNEVSFNSFSSGQKTRMEIAIAFSMFMMAKIFFSSTINLLVFDEILDMNLDKEGFNSVFQIIENFSQSNAIFVVSHQEFYKDKFKHHLKVKLNTDKFTQIVEES